MNRDFHIVGIGASAGSLPVMIELFKRIPLEVNAAFVVITHLMRDKRSYLDEILARHANLPVIRVESTTPINPGHIYVMAENTYLVCAHHILWVHQREPNIINESINVFLSSLAQDAGKSAIAVILSGGGSDGLKGCQAIHAQGGKILVQDPETAMISGMPWVVCEFDHADLVNDISILTQELILIITSV
jgi:chemotaxis response regulator CheB